MQLRDGAALLVLEQAARRRDDLALRDVLKRQLRDPQQAPRIEPALATLRALQAAGDGLSRPAQLLDAGYGLPFGAERDALADEVGAGARTVRGLRSRLEDQAHAALPPEAQARITASDRNLEQLGTRLRELHHQTGGLRLE